MDLRQLYYFLEVAETGSVTLAATRVYISQPALSRQIQLLEAELGVKLMERVARGIVLTEAGELLRQRASILIKDAILLKEEIGAHANEPSGTVGLGVPSALRTILTSRIAGTYAISYPNALLKIRESMSRVVREMVTSGETDVAIFSTEEPRKLLRCEPLLSEQLVAIGPLEARLSMRHAMSIEMLCKHPLILTSYPNSLRQIIDRAASKAGTTAHPSVEVDMAALMLDLVRQGIGYAVLPYSAAKELLSSNLISACPLHDMRISWVVATSQERMQSVASKRLTELIFSEVKQLVTTGQWLTAELAT